MKNNFYKCDKCGSSIAKNGEGWLCVQSVPYRTSEICGGSLSIEITEEDYNSMIDNWVKLREEKNG